MQNKLGGTGHAHWQCTNLLLEANAGHFLPQYMGNQLYNHLYNHVECIYTYSFIKLR